MNVETLTGLLGLLAIAISIVNVVAVTRRHRRVMREIRNTKVRVTSQQHDMVRVDVIHGDGHVRTWVLPARRPAENGRG